MSDCVARLCCHVGNDYCLGETRLLSFSQPQDLLITKAGMARTSAVLCTIFKVFVGGRAQGGGGGISGGGGGELTGL